MSDFEFLHPERIHFIWLAVAFVALLVWLELRGRDALSRFVSRKMQLRLAAQLGRGRRLASIAFIGLTLALGVAVLMRPQTVDKENVVSEEVRADIVVVLDLSKSMLATDAAPTRLDRAKAEIRDMLPDLSGNQVALVGFAGRSRILTPLTPDISFFNLVLESADPESIGRGGTRIGDGIRKGLEALGESGEKRARIMLLITDGEDHESYPLEAAEQAADQGVTIVAIGFGDEEGSKIEYVNEEGELETVKDQSGNAVISRLDGETLRKIAFKTDGVYIPAGVAVLDLESILARHIQPLLDEPTEVEVRETRVELYPWFLLAAMMALFGAVVVRSRLFFSGEPVGRQEGALAESV